MGTLQDSLIKDLLISGLHKSNLFIKEKFLQEDDLTLKRALKICKTLELSQGQAHALQAKEDLNVYAVQSNSRNNRQIGKRQFRDVSSNSCLQTKTVIMIDNGHLVRIQ